MTYTVFGGTLNLAQPSTQPNRDVTAIVHGSGIVSVDVGDMARYSGNNM